MIELFLGLVFIILLVGSYTDLKTREVPDWISYGSIIAGLGLRALWSAATLDYSFVLNGVIGFAIFFGLACALFYLGQWGGGDAKILMGMGAILGIDLSLQHPMIAFLINLLFVGGIYGLFWILYLGFKQRKKVKKELVKISKAKPAKYAAVCSAILFIMFTLLSLSTQDPNLSIPAFMLAILPMCATVTIFLTKAIEKVALIKTVKIKDLTEGDWVLSNIKRSGKTICSEKDVGITKKQISQLKRLKIKSVVIKEGIPFIPGFFLAYCATLGLGNIVLLFL